MRAWVKRLRLLLAPLSVIFWCATALRNWMYDRRWLRSSRFFVPTICVGNITVGGVGKTPLTEHLVRMLSERVGLVGIVSRGYKRQSSGQVVAVSTSTAYEIGDEPRQLKMKFPHSILVVDADRVAAIDKADVLGAKVIVMDDGMQHRRVNPKVTIMVCDYARPMWRDLPLPAGNLREPWAGRRRAQVIVVNKCPENLTREEADAIERRMKLEAGQSIFFSAIDYDPTRELGCDTPVVAVAGIGRPEPFFQEVERRYRVVVRRAFPDHHVFTRQDMDRIVRDLIKLGKNSAVVCTEKDGVRLPEIGRHQTVVLPIKTCFLFDEEEKFNNKILELCQ